MILEGLEDCWWQLNKRHSNKGQMQGQLHFALKFSYVYVKHCSQVGED